MGIDFKGYRRNTQKEEAGVGVNIMINDICSDLILENLIFFKSSIDSNIEILRLYSIDMDIQKY